MFNLKKRGVLDVPIGPGYDLPVSRDIGWNTTKINKERVILGL